MKPKDWLKKVSKGLEAAFRDWKKASITLLISSSTFILMAMASTAGASLNMLRTGIEWWIPAVQYGITGLHLTGGWTNVALVGLYSVLTGVAVTNLTTTIRNSGNGFLGLSGVLPGFIAAGCAGCGMGVLGILGMTGAIATLPMQGNGFRIAGVGLLIYFIGRKGDPSICSNPVE